MRVSPLYCTFVSMMLMALPLCAQDNPAHKIEIYPLGIADFDNTVDLLKSVISKDGKIVPDANGNRVIIVDTPEVHKQVKQIINALQIPQKNVRVRVRFDNHSSSSQKKFGVGGTVHGGDVTVTTTPGKPGGSIHVDALDGSSIANSMTQQELLVINNGSASLEVTTEVPYHDWIFNYGITHGFWTSTTQWRSVGAKLRIKPSIYGEQIRIKLTPELSALVDGKPDVISLEKLTTEVVAQNGQEVSLGGLPAEAQDFYSKFLVGYDEHHQIRSLNICLTPIIEDPFVPPK